MRNKERINSPASPTILTNHTGSQLSTQKSAKVDSKEERINHNNRFPAHFGSQIIICNLEYAE
jgi:hypothetical protein